MRDLLAAAGAFALTDLALPLALWTAAALVAEIGLRASRAHAAVGLPLRSALVAALPAVLAAGPLTRWLMPEGAVVPAVMMRAQTAVLPEVIVGAPSVIAPSVPPAELLGLGAALCVAGLIGLVACVRLVVAYVRLRRFSWPEAPADVQARAVIALDEAGARRPVRVVVGGSVPFTFGWRRPVIAVPAGLAGEALDLVLDHEAAHVRAGDAAGHASLSLVAAVCAAHPLVHVLVRGTALDRERLADAAVLARRPGAGPAYGRLLVSFASASTPRLALGAAPGAAPLIRRLTAMTTLLPHGRLRAVRRSGRLLGFLALAAVSLAGFATTADGPRGTRSFRLLNPTTSVDGVVAERGGMEITADGFRYLEVAFIGYGRFVVSDAPFDGAARAGQFNGARLDVTAGGHTLTIRSDTPLFDGGERVPAYARFEAAPGTPRLVPDAPLIIGVTQDLDGFGSLDPAEYERALREAMDAQLERELAGNYGPPGMGWGVTAAGDTVYDSVDEMPVLVGGMDALAGRLVYPADAKAEGVEGRAVVRFVVGLDGSTEQVAVVRSSGDARLDSAAVAAVRAQPFTPGTHRGRAFRVRLALPVLFRLPPSDDRGALPERPGDGVVRYSTSAPRISADSSASTAATMPSQDNAARVGDGLARFGDWFRVIAAVQAIQGERERAQETWEAADVADMLEVVLAATSPAHLLPADQP